ncbi:hypothetical protein HNQ91_000835 [Filimonas zeae]|nr:hypothetical protein [Filimonas zeae]MDR6337813.1 hypothetical protein [Filimonas zeae]
MLRLIVVVAIFLTTTLPLYSQHEDKYKEDSAKVFHVSLQTFAFIAS